MSSPITHHGPYSVGNLCTLYTDGDTAYAAAFEAIEQARERVWLETYILELDEVGQLAIRALARAAQRGCDVILLYDRWGSLSMRAKHASELEAAGGRIVMYNPIFSRKKRGRRVAPFLYRDHRKILIADGVGFCGGRNISTEYGGPGEELFYDMTLRMVGPCVRDLADVFLDTLHLATQDAIEPPTPLSADPTGVPVEILALNNRKKQHDLDLGIQALLKSAQTYCYLMTPYFIPPRWFLKELIQTAQRGVDIHILTAGRSDVPAARLAGRHVYGSILRHGIHIHELKRPILHAKCLTVDGHYSIIGSYNIDRYGAKHNLEVGVAIEDPHLARLIEIEFGAMRADADLYTLERHQNRTWKQRFVAWFLFQLSRI